MQVVNISSKMRSSPTTFRQELRDTSLTQGQTLGKARGITFLLKSHHQHWGSLIISVQLLVPIAIGGMGIARDTGRRDAIRSLGHSIGVVPLDDPDRIAGNPGYDATVFTVPHDNDVTDPHIAAVVGLGGQSEEVLAALHHTAQPVDEIAAPGHAIVSVKAAILCVIAASGRRAFEIIGIAALMVAPLGLGDQNDIFYLLSADEPL